MADKTMHHVVIGSDTYEIVDEQGRATAATNTQDISSLKEDYDDIDDRVTALEGGGSGSGLTEDIKAALLQMARKVAYVDAQGQTYYDALYGALYPPADLVSISAVYTQSGTVYDTDTLDSLKGDLVVTAHMSDQTTRTVTTYTLSGTLAEGTSTITVAYGGKTTTFDVAVTSSVTTYDYIAMTYADGDTIPGNSGLLTDIAMSSDYVLETSVYFDSTITISNPTNIMGSRNGGSGTKEFAIFLKPSTKQLGYWWGGSDTSKVINPYVPDQVNTIKIQPVGMSETYPNDMTFVVNGNEYDSGATASGTTFSPWIGFFKYGISATQTSTSGTDKYAGAKIGETVIKTQSGTVLHRLQPAFDGEHYGLRDAVTGNFYYNASYADKYTCGNWT